MYRTTRHGAARQLLSTRRYATARQPGARLGGNPAHLKSHPTPGSIAVLGGGLTGLTTAHYLARAAPDSRIVLYDAANTLGGWVEAEAVKVPGAAPSHYDGHVLFQHGPRMLRSSITSSKYDDLVFFDVVSNLGLAGKIQRSPAVADSRYLYYPDHLVKLPKLDGKTPWSSLFELVRTWLTEPVFSGLLRAMYQLVKAKTQAQVDTVNPDFSSEARADDLEEDPSVAEFLNSILKSERFINNTASAVMHGIYGGNINKLSAKHTVLEKFWLSVVEPLPAEENAIHITTKDLMLTHDMNHAPNATNIHRMAKEFVKQKITNFQFEDGLITLVKALVGDLERMGNVTIKRAEPVTAVQYHQPLGQVSLTTTKSKTPARYDHVISTLFSKQLARIAEPKGKLPSLEQTHAVTIMVVNLWYPNPDLLRDKHGFGYLVPTSAPDNVECVLGVLFDSDMPRPREVPGTKLTVMMGGHYWDGWQQLPDKELGIALAKQAVQRQLGISAQDNETCMTSARLCRECLPQHFVGHRERMQEAHSELLKAFHGKLSVAGPSYTSVGVLPSMRAGYDVAMRVAHGHGPPYFNQTEVNTTVVRKKYARRGQVAWDHVGATGLEGFTGRYIDSVLPVRRNMLGLRRWPTGRATVSK
ncbi:Protoporphyrinogen oxidase [Xylariomycetidae sp. FL0641]|nr:Protoporphyrinogen oxidase [Xylariomycetidae sp. FL0641]